LKDRQLGTFVLNTLGISNASNHKTVGQTSLRLHRPINNHQVRLELKSKLTGHVDFAEDEQDKPSATHVILGVQGKTGPGVPPETSGGKG